MRGASACNGFGRPGGRRAGICDTGTEADA